MIAVATEMEMWLTEDFGMGHNIVSLWNTIQKIKLHDK